MHQISLLINFTGQPSCSNEMDVRVLYSTGSGPHDILKLNTQRIIYCAFVISYIIRRSLSAFCY